MYFKETDAKNIVCDGVFASAKLTSVFGGNGNITMRTSNIVKENPDTPLFGRGLVVSKMLIDEF